MLLNVWCKIHVPALPGVQDDTGDFKVVFKCWSRQGEPEMNNKKTKQCFKNRTDCVKQEGFATLNLKKMKLTLSVHVCYKMVAWSISCFFDQVELAQHQANNSLIPVHFFLFIPVHDELMGWTTVNLDKSN